MESLAIAEATANGNKSPMAKLRLGKLVVNTLMDTGVKISTIRADVATALNQSVDVSKAQQFRAVMQEQH